MSQEFCFELARTFVSALFKNKAAEKKNCAVQIMQLRRRLGRRGERTLTMQFHRRNQGGRRSLRRTLLDHTSPLYRADKTVILLVMPGAVETWTVFSSSVHAFVRPCLFCRISQRLLWLLPNDTVKRWLCRSNHW